MARGSDTIYSLTEAQITRFRSEGYLHLPGLLTEDEVAQLERTFQRFLAGEIPVEGRDLCDMSGTYDRPAEEFAIINVMLPRRYLPELVGDVYEQCAASVAEQLCGPDMGVDYDQLLAKAPSRDDAVFEWHQDLAYWPVTPDTRTASFWLALDETTVANGCLNFVPGSNTEPELRPHGPLLGDRDRSHTLVATLREDDVPRPVELKRGDATVHSERVLHGSRGNTTAGWRRGWVLAFRSNDTIARERAMGFTHSHNDDMDVLDGVGE